MAESIRIITIPATRNRILIRLENIADYVEQSGGSQTQLFDLESHLDALWKKANAHTGRGYKNLVIFEASITANMKFQEMVDRKLEWRGEEKPWRTVDDGQSESSYKRTKVSSDADPT